MRKLLVTLQSSCSSVAQGSGVSDRKAAVLCGRGLDIARRYEAPVKLFTEWVFETVRSE